MANIAILCIDDDWMVLKALGEQLHRHFGRGYIIELAQSAKEALSVCAELSERGAKLSLVISDQKMPEMSGDLLIRRLHGLYPHALKFLLTGHADSIALANVINVSALHRYIAKPWLEEDLIEKVSEALQQFEMQQQWRMQVQSLKAPILERLSQPKMPEDVA